MIEKALEQIDEADLQALVSQRRAEGRRLDFKLALPGGTEKAVKELLVDVTSFANSDGGDLIFGIRDDKNAVAAELVGVPAEKLDEEIRAIEDQVRNCVDPRLPEFRVHPVMLGSGRAALILRLPSSLTGPHRVTYRGTSRFYARNSRGKYEMDTGELRLAFAATDEMPRKIRDLHARAIAAIGGENMPTRLHSEPIAILTVAPLSVFREARDIRVVREEAVLPPRVSGAIEMVVGLDGLIVHSPIEAESGAVRTWAVNHRRGYVDFAWAIGRTNDWGQRIIWRKYFDEQLVGAARSTVARLRQHGIEGPWVAMVTLRGIKGFSVIMAEDYFTDPAWQDPAYLGEVIDEVLDENSLRPLINAFWRVFGVEDV